MAIHDRRKEGDTSPYSVRVNLGESINLASLTKKFYLKTLDLETSVVDGSAAQAVDITAEEGGASAPSLSIWQLSYTPSAGDVDAPGDYLARFTVTYAGADTRSYPGEHEWMWCEIAPA